MDQNVRRPDNCSSLTSRCLAVRCRLGTRLCTGVSVDAVVAVVDVFAVGVPIAEAARAEALAETALYLGVDCAVTPTWLICEDERPMIIPAEVVGYVATPAIAEDDDEEDAHGKEDDEEEDDEEEDDEEDKDPNPSADGIVTPLDDNSSRSAVVEVERETVTAAAFSAASNAADFPRATASPFRLLAVLFFPFFSPEARFAAFRVIRSAAAFDASEGFLHSAQRP